MSILAMASGKGGAGKSCVAAYTGAALGAAGRKVLLLELGAEARSLDLITGVQEKAAFDLSDVLEGRCEAGEAILPAAIAPNLYLLPAQMGGRSRSPSGTQRMQGLIRACAEEYDHLILDGVDFSLTPPSLPGMIWLVTTPDSLSVRACAQLSRELLEAGARNLRLVINNVPAQVLPIYGARDFDDVIDQVGAQLIGVIPASPKLAYSANNGEPLDEASLTVEVFGNLAARLQGQKRPLLIR